MSLDPELADAPEHPDAIAWEIRWCADRLSSLAEASWEPFGDSPTYWSLWQAANSAYEAAHTIDGGRGERR